MTRLRELAGMWLTAARLLRDMPAILDAQAIAHAELADEVERLRARVAVFADVPSFVPPEWMDRA